MTCSDSFFCSSGSRSYKSLRAPHPFAEWLHANRAFVLLLTLKTFISDPRTLPPSSTAWSAASLCQPWVFLKYLMLTTCFLWGCLRHAPGEAQASCARGPSQRLWRHADLLYFLLFPSPPSLLSICPDPLSLCSLTWLLLLQGLQCCGSWERLQCCGSWEPALSRAASVLPCRWDVVGQEGPRALEV